MKHVKRFCLKSLIISVVIAVISCGYDPLVVDDNGILRSAISIEDLEKNEISLCDDIDNRKYLSSQFDQVSVTDTDLVVFVQNDIAICTGYISSGYYDDEISYQDKELSVESLYATPIPVPLMISDNFSYHDKELSAESLYTDPAHELDRE